MFVFVSEIAPQRVGRIKGADCLEGERLQALAFKAIRRLYPDYPLWRDFAYEYEHDRLAIDLINGSPLLREWVDDPTATPDQLDALTAIDEAAWLAATTPFHLYR